MTQTAQATEAEAARVMVPAPETAFHAPANDEQGAVATAPATPTHPEPPVIKEPEIKEPKIKEPEIGAPKGPSAHDHLAVANDNEAASAIMPEGPTIKIPPQAAGPADTPAKPEAPSQDLLIEKNLAAYFGQHLPAELTKGLKITVVADSSNRITANTAVLDGQMDVGLMFTGPALESHNTATALRDAVLKALNAHPAFADYNITGGEKDVLHTLTIGMNGLSKKRFAELLKPQPTVAPAATHDAVPETAVAIAEAPQTTVNKPVVTQDIVASLNSAIIGAAR